MTLPFQKRFLRLKENDQVRNKTVFKNPFGTFILNINFRMSLFFEKILNVGRKSIWWTASPFISKASLSKAGLPLRTMGSFPSLRSDSRTTCRGWDGVSRPGSTVLSSYTTSSLEKIPLKESLLCRQEMRSRTVILPCWSRRRLILSEQLMCMAPRMWLLLNSMKGRQSMMTGTGPTGWPSGQCVSFLASSLGWMTRMLPLLRPEERLGVL